MGDGDEYFSEYAEANTVPQSDHERYPNLLHKHLWPLPNVWLMATVCNQDEADRLIPILLEIPAAVRGVSIEPMLGPVNLMPHIFSEPGGEFRTHNGKRQIRCVKPSDGGLHWVICGGETGPGARPMHPDWGRGLRDQCAAADVPFFFKSWGEWLPCSQCADDPYLERLDPYTEIGDDGITVTDTGGGVICRNGVSTEQIFRVGKSRSGRLLDGVEHSQFPEVRP